MSGCPTALKTIKIIELISKHPEGLILSEIAAKLGYPVSTVFDILHTLVLEDIIVIKDGRLKNYAIGPKLYIYGSAYIKTSNLINISKRYLKDIADETGFTAFIVKRNSEECVPVYKYEPENAKVITNNIGDVLNMFDTAPGKLFLANDENYMDLINNHHFVKNTDYTILDKEKYIDEIEKARKTSVAIDFRESQSHIVCVACAIYDKYNSLDPIAGVISLNGLYTKDINIDMLSRKLYNVASSIQQILELTERISK